MISNKPKPKPKRYEVHNRYLFEGRLVMQTALHIGGGKFTLSHSDSPVVLTPEQQPFIPGSSFKGALRSTIEKIVPGLPGFSSCALTDLSDKALEEAHEREEKVCPTVRQREITQARRRAPERAEKIMQEAID